jgi:hypothetical protein
MMILTPVLKMVFGMSSDYESGRRPRQPQGGKTKNNDIDFYFI